MNKGDSELNLLHVFTSTYIDNYILKIFVYEKFI